MIKKGWKGIKTPWKLDQRFKKNTDHPQRFNQRGKLMNYGKIRENAGNTYYGAYSEDGKCSLRNREEYSNWNIPRNSVIYLNKALETDFCHIKNISKAF